MGSDDSCHALGIDTPDQALDQVLPGMVSKVTVTIALVYK